MTKNEFIKLQESDLKTLDNAVYNNILKLFKENIPDDAIINDKSVSGMYSYMKEYARKRANDGCYCIDSIDEFKKLMFEYLDIKESKQKEISLEDLFL